MNGDEEKTFTTILLAIKGEVGETKGKVSGMCDDLAHIKGKMAAVVTRNECTGKHKMLEEALARTMTEVKTELRDGIADLKKTSTGQAHQSITPAMLAAAAAAPAHEMTPAEMEAALASRAEERAEKRRKAITWYLGTGVVLLGLLGTVGTFVYKTVLTLDKVQTAISAQPAEMRREIQQAAAKQKIVYVQVPQPAVRDEDAPRRAPALPPRRPPDRKTAKKAIDR